MDLKYSNLVADVTSSNEGKQLSALMDVVQQINLGRDISHWMPSVVSRGAAAGAHPSVRKLTYHIASACSIQLQPDDFKKLKAAVLRDLTEAGKREPGGRQGSPKKSAAAAADTPPPSAVDSAVYALRFAQLLPHGKLVQLFRDEAYSKALKTLVSHDNYRVRETALGVLGVLASASESLHEVSLDMRAAYVSSYLDRYAPSIVEGVQDPVDSVSIAAFTALRHTLCYDHRSDYTDLKPHAAAAAFFEPYFLRFHARAHALSLHTRPMALLPLTLLSANGSGAPSLVVAPEEVVRDILLPCLRHTDIPDLVVEAGRCILLVVHRRGFTDPEVLYQVADQFVFLLETAFGGGVPISANTEYVRSVVECALRVLPKLPRQHQIPFCMRLLSLATRFAQQPLLSLRSSIITTSMDTLLRLSLTFAASRLQQGDPLAPQALFSEILSLKEHDAWKATSIWSKWGYSARQDMPHSPQHHLLHAGGTTPLPGQGGGSGSSSSPFGGSFGEPHGGGDAHSGVTQHHAGGGGGAAAGGGGMGSSPGSPAGRGGGDGCSGDFVTLHDELVFALCAGVSRLHHTCVKPLEESGAGGLDPPSGAEFPQGGAVVLAAWCGLGVQVATLCLPQLRLPQERLSQNVVAVHQTMRLLLKVQADGVDALRRKRGTRSSDPTGVFTRNQGSWLRSLQAANRTVQRELAALSLDPLLMLRHRNVTKVILLCTVATLLPRLADVPDGEAPTVLEPCGAAPGDAGAAPAPASQQQRKALEKAVRRRGSSVAEAAPLTHDMLEKQFAISLAKACQTYIVGGERETMSLALFDALLYFGAVRGTQSSGAYWEKSERVVEMILRDASKSATAPQIMMVVKHKLDNVRKMMTAALRESGGAGCAALSDPSQLARCGVTVFSEHHPAFFHDMTPFDMELVAAIHESELALEEVRLHCPQRALRCGSPHDTLVTAPDDPLQILASYRWEGPDVVICIAVTNALPLPLRQLRVTVGCRGDMVPIHVPGVSVYASHGVCGSGGAEGGCDVFSRSDIIRKLKPGETVEIVRSFAVASLTPGVGFAPVVDVPLAVNAPGTDDDDAFALDEQGGSDMYRLRCDFVPLSLEDFLVMHHPLEAYPVSGALQMVSGLPVSKRLHTVHPAADVAALEAHIEEALFHTPLVNLSPSFTFDSAASASPAAASPSPSTAQLSASTNVGASSLMHMVFVCGVRNVRTVTADRPDVLSLTVTCVATPGQSIRGSTRGHMMGTPGSPDTLHPGCVVLSWLFQGSVHESFECVTGHPSFTAFFERVANVSPSGESGPGAASSGGGCGAPGPEAWDDNPATLGIGGDPLEEWRTTRETGARMDRAKKVHRTAHPPAVDAWAEWRCDADAVVDMPQQQQGGPPEASLFSPPAAGGGGGGGGEGGGGGGDSSLFPAPAAAAASASRFSPPAGGAGGGGGEGGAQASSAGLFAQPNASLFAASSGDTGFFPDVDAPDAAARGGDGGGGGSLFAAPAVGDNSLFGAAPAAAPGGSDLFGAPASDLFGAAGGGASLFPSVDEPAAGGGGGGAEPAAEAQPEQQQEGSDSESSSEAPPKPSQPVVTSLFGAAAAGQQPSSGGEGGGGGADLFSAAPQPGAAAAGGGSGGSDSESSSEAPQREAKPAPAAEVSLFGETPATAGGGDLFSAAQPEGAAAAAAGGLFPDPDATAAPPAGNDGSDSESSSEAPQREAKPAPAPAAEASLFGAAPGGSDLFGAPASDLFGAAGGGASLFPSVDEPAAGGGGAEPAAEAQPEQQQEGSDSESSSEAPQREAKPAPAPAAEVSLFGETPATAGGGDLFSAAQPEGAAAAAAGGLFPDPDAAAPPAGNDASDSESSSEAPQREAKPAPAAEVSLFGAAPAAAPGGSDLFGAPASDLFGAAGGGASLFPSVDEPAAGGGGGAEPAAEAQPEQQKPHDASDSESSSEAPQREAQPAPAAEVSLFGETPATAGGGDLFSAAQPEGAAAAGGLFPDPDAAAPPAGNDASDSESSSEAPQREADPTPTPAAEASLFGAAPEVSPDTTAAAAGATASLFPDAGPPDTTTLQQPPAPPTGGGSDTSSTPPQGEAPPAEAAAEGTAPQGDASLFPPETPPHGAEAAAAGAQPHDASDSESSSEAPQRAAPAPAAEVSLFGETPAAAGGGDLFSAAPQPEGGAAAAAAGGLFPDPDAAAGLPQPAAPCLPLAADEVSPQLFPEAAAEGGAGGALFPSAAEAPVSPEAGECHKGWAGGDSCDAIPALDQPDAAPEVAVGADEEGCPVDAETAPVPGIADDDAKSVASS